MKFGKFPLDECLDGILAHSLKIDGLRLKKGTRLTADHIARLKQGEIRTLTVARLDSGDIHEDEAAQRIAEAISGGAQTGVTVERAFTGRANLFADNAGVLCVDRGAINALNRIDPAITLACLPEHASVESGRMVATVKIIPYGVSRALIERAEATARGQAQLLSVAPYRPMKVAVISTRLPSLKATTIDKTLAVTRDRIAPAGAEVVADIRVTHDADQVAKALRQAAADGAQLMVIFGASANVDAGDVLPAAIELAGGRVKHFGMPVDPGNLLVLGELDGKPVVGAPGCARSPRENGFDWVLQRMLAGLDVAEDDLTGMGVGGLLMEIVSRPQPREETPEDSETPDVAAILLAAGRSTRMGGPNKLLATIDGEPLVRIAARNALASIADSLTVVTGHMHDEVERALDGLDVTLVHNPDFREGLSTSLKTGIAALPSDVDAAIVLLADMPRVASATIDRIIQTYDPAGGSLIVVPTVKGKRGNPVLWSRRYFDDLVAIKGDVGARHLIGTNPEAVVEVEIDATIRLDLDTPGALEAAGGILPKI